MKGVKYDEAGIPILSREDIELWSEKFITYFDKDCFDLPRPTPLGSICFNLLENHNVKFVFGADLGLSPEGYQYRGRFHISSNTIYIDRSLQYGDPRYNFTLAHEVAHFVMHRKVSLSRFQTDQDEISDTNRSLILDHVQSNNPREWLEWQANKFASSLLLPRKTVPFAVIAIQKELGITRLGKIYLDRQGANIAYYNAIMESLAKLYETSKASIKLRLKELEILVETDTGFSAHSRPVVTISEAMKEYFKSLQNTLDNV